MNKIISVYELLGLIKDGKAPKKIKFDDTEYKCGNGYYYRIDNEIPKIFTNEYNIFLCLNDKVEILEEDKPIIEKINGGMVTSRAVYTNFNDVFKDMSKSYETIDDIIIKLNEVIDYINRKEINDKN